MPLLHHAERDQVGVTEAISDLGDLGGGGSARLVVALDEVVQQRAEQHVAALGDVTLTARRATARARANQPERWCGLPTEEPAVADPEGTPNGRHRRTRIHVGLVGPLQGAT